MQKYLKITQEDFHKACEISHMVQNSFSSVFGFAKLAKFCTRWEIHFSQSCSLSCSLYSFWHLACYAKLLDVRFLLWFSSLHTWLIWQRLRSSPKTWILYVFELQLAFPWTIQNSPSFLARFNDQKSYQKHQNLPKTD